MKPEVVVFLVVNLLPLHNLAMLADIAPASSLSSIGGINAHGGGRILRPAGTDFKVRRKRLLADDEEYQKAGTDRNIADIGDAPKSIFAGHTNRHDWSQPETAWIRRRSYNSRVSSSPPFRPRGTRRSAWSEADVQWLKRRADIADNGEVQPVKRRWENTGFSWLKRHREPEGLELSKGNLPITKRLAEELGDAADHWNSGFDDINWIKRHRPRDTDFGRADQTD